MKQLNYLRTLMLLIVVPIIAITSSGQDNPQSRKYPLNDFKKVYLEGSYRVYLIQGDTAGLEIRSNDADIFDLIEVNNNESALSLKVTRNHIDFSRVTLYITVKDLEKMIIQGGVNLKTKGYLKLNDFYVGVEGGANIDMDLKANHVQINGQGGVLVELSGESKVLDVKLEGAGHVNAGELKSETVNFRIDGVGTGSVNATKELNASLHGVGKILYRGDPVVNKNIDGLGTVARN